MPPTPRGAFSTMANVGRIMPLPDCCLDLREIVPFVQAQVLRVLSRRPWSPHGEAVQRDRRRFHVMTVGAGHHESQRGAALIGQRVALRAKLAAIRRIRACRGPPSGALTMTVSSACHRHWMLRRSS